MLGKQREQLLQALEPCRPGDLLLPGFERVRAGVVAARDDILGAPQIRSMTAAMAWPWPMHIVAIP